MAENLNLIAGWITTLKVELKIQSEMSLCAMIMAMNYKYKIVISNCDKIKINKLTSTVAICTTPTKMIRCVRWLPYESSFYGLQVNKLELNAEDKTREDRTQVGCLSCK